MAKYFYESHLLFAVFTILKLLLSFRFNFVEYQIKEKRENNNTKFVLVADTYSSNLIIFESMLLIFINCHKFYRNAKVITR